MLFSYVCLMYKLAVIALMYLTSVTSIVRLQNTEIYRIYNAQALSSALASLEIL